MLRNYLKIALRNITRQKAFSLLNISGLTIGMTASILILLWVRDENSFDRFNKNANEIFRLTVDANGFKAAVNPAGMPGGLKAQLPAILNTTRLNHPGNVLFATGNRKFIEEKVFFADPSFLDLFSYQLLEGNRSNALSRIDGVLITRAMGKKYFGSEDPMGKVLRKDNSENVVITGVLADIPSNSHLQFDFILPMASLARTDDDLKNHIWSNFDFYSYLLLDKKVASSNTSLQRLEGRIDEIYQKHVPEFTGAKFHLQPLSRIHLEPAIQVDLPGHGNALYVRIFFVVAILIMAVACINFMNLTTARSGRRSKEIGLRKVSGAYRGQLIGQFLGESMLISLCALALAIGLVWIVLPWFNSLSGKTLHFDLLDMRLLLTLLVIALATGLLSGSYPAIFLSGFKLVSVVKGSTGSPGKRPIFRNALVVGQFVASIVLLVGTATIYYQLKFMQERDPGFKKDNLLYLKFSGELYNKQKAMEDALAKNPLTNNFSFVSELPINLPTGAIQYDWQGKDPNMRTVIPSMGIDEHFISTFKMRMVSGRAFSTSSRADSNNYIINEKLARIMGRTPESAVGKSFSYGSIKGMIVGVVADFNFKPVQQAIEPLALMLNRWIGYVVIRTKPETTAQTINALSKICSELNPSYPFQYDFIDQDIANEYRGEQQMSSIFNLFSALAVFISCLGLYGLSAFIAEQRRKEIGVRKVLGASVTKIVYLLSGNIIRLIILAIVIALPIAWYGAHEWLQGFAFHIEIGWSLFVFASVGALAIAWLTVSFESLRAATTNPVKSLRSE